VSLSIPTGAPTATGEGRYVAEDLIEGEESAPTYQGARADGRPVIPSPSAAAAPEFDAEFDDFASVSESAVVMEPDPAPEEAEPALLTDPVREKVEETSHAGSTSSLEDDLDEADFFIGQNLFDEAKQILSDLLGRYPNHPLVLAKLQDVEAVQGQGPDEAEPEPDLRPPDPPPPPTQTQRESGPLKRPAVIAKALGEEDADTHWDLGLAYKEMGLYDEAIREFSLILNTPGRAVQCELMIGRCHAERGKSSEAIAEFKKGLYIEGITELQSLDLYFEIGASYEALGDAREALYYYEKVAKRDPRFREVEKRVDSLKARGAVSGPSSHRPNGNVDSRDDDSIDLMEESSSGGDVTAQ
jgi:tetratricopeptide (TPR) repeat protein